MLADVQLCAECMQLWLQFGVALHKQHPSLAGALPSAEALFKQHHCKPGWVASCLSARCVPENPSWPLSRSLQRWQSQPAHPPQSACAPAAVAQCPAAACLQGRALTVMSGCSALVGPRLC